MSINHNITQSEIDNSNIQWTLEKRIQSIEMKKSGWNFEKIDIMSISLKKSKELNGSSYVTIPLRSFASVNNKNDGKFCFIWSVLASLHPGIIIPNRVSINKHYFK